MGTVFGAVIAVFDITPRVRRIIFDVPKLDELSLTGNSDEAVGLYFPRELHQPPPAMSCSDDVWAYHDPDEAPEGRNYTIRQAGPGPRQLTIDFALHDHGPATAFAREARRGDQVVMAHARSWYRPPRDAQWQLLVADLAGQPALARIIEDLPAHVHAYVIAEVVSDADCDYLPVRDNVTVRTSVGTGNGLTPSMLSEMVAGFEHPDGYGYCWFAGEAAQSRAVRKHLRAEFRFRAAQFDIVGYWRMCSEEWDRRFEKYSAEMMNVYTQALAEGKGDKIATEELDLALERVGL